MAPCLVKKSLPDCRIIGCYEVSRGHNLSVANSLCVLQRKDIFLSVVVAGCRRSLETCPGDRDHQTLTELKRYGPRAIDLIPQRFDLSARVGPKFSCQNVTPCEVNLIV